MKLLLVTSVDPWTRSVSSIHHFVAAARGLGHEIKLYGPANPELPGLPYSTELDGVDLALFVIQVPGDFPDMPYLARLMDGVPRQKRAVIDLWGRYNDTIRVEHDFNHLERLDGHLGWEWEDAIKAVSDTILQPGLAPLRQDVGSFLLHGFAPEAVICPEGDVAAAAARWRDAGPQERPFGVMYVGSNWQRWDQVRDFLAGYEPARARVGRACLAGWDWGRRPDWAIDKGLAGIDTDPAFLAAHDVEIRDGVRFDELVGLLGQARFAPVFHRPLFRQLGYVTARSFETFHADTLPVLMLPRDFVAAIYGNAALKLVPGDDIAGFMADALSEPRPYWQALFETRAHLAQHHSYERRVADLVARVATKAVAGAA